MRERVFDVGMVSNLSEVQKFLNLGLMVVRIRIVKNQK